MLCTFVYRITDCLRGFSRKLLKLYNLLGDVLQRPRISVINVNKNKNHAIELQNVAKFQAQGNVQILNKLLNEFFDHNKRRIFKYFGLKYRLNEHETSILQNQLVLGRNKFGILKKSQQSGVYAGRESTERFRKLFDSNITTSECDLEMRKTKRKLTTKDKVMMSGSSGKRIVSSSNILSDVSLMMNSCIMNGNFHYPSYHSNKEINLKTGVDKKFC